MMHQKLWVELILYVALLVWGGNAYLYSEKSSSRDLNSRLKGLESVETSQKLEVEVEQEKKQKRTSLTSLLISEPSESSERVNYQLC